MKQVTIKIEAFTTVTLPDNWEDDLDVIPVRLDVYDSVELEDSHVVEVIETQITKKEISSVTNI
jgi:hypothetical protein